MKIRKTLIFILVIILLACNSEDNTEPITDDPVLPVVNSIGETNKIEIVTWNIERFPKTDISDEYVKAIIVGLDADIFILQEIQNRFSLSNMVDKMDDYNFFLKTNDTGLSMAILYKNSVVKLENSFVLLNEYKDYFASRPPLLTKVRWQNAGIIKQLSIINVHYKCCGDNYIEIGDDEDEEYRRLKASEVLEKYVAENLASENVIIGGDFNDAIEEPGSTNVFSPFLNKPTNYKFVDLDIANGAATNWSWPGWNSSFSAIHFDHLLINNNLFDELRNATQVEVIRLEEFFENGFSDYDTHVSDHRPLYFKFTP